MGKIDKSTRSRIMSAIKSKNTSPELKIFQELRKRKIRFLRHYAKLLGSPDIAIPKQKKVLFIDGDFWHGFRYPLWERRLKNEFWHKKIERNRKRDKICHRRLRYMGWQVMRVWEHQINNDFEKTINKISLFLK